MKNTDNLNLTSANNETEENLVKVSLVNQSVFIRKKKTCPLRDVNIEDINYD